MIYPVQKLRAVSAWTPDEAEAAHKRAQGGDLAALADFGAWSIFRHFVRLGQRKAFAFESARSFLSAVDLRLVAHG